MSSFFQNKKLFANNSSPATSNNLETLDYALAKFYNKYKDSENKEADLIEFAKEQGLKKATSWFIPQAQARLVQRYPAKKVGEKYSIVETLGSMANEDKMIYFIFLDNTRSHYITGSMTTVPQYCSLVPLVLAAYKKYANINYSDWDSESYSLGIHSGLLDCINTNTKQLVGYCNEFIENNHHEEGLKGLKVESYRDEDYLNLMRFIRATKVDDVASHKPSLARTPFAKTPKWLPMIELQLWVAQPRYHNDYMILNIRNLDDRPKPLVEKKLLVEVPSINDHPFLK